MKNKNYSITKIARQAVYILLSGLCLVIVVTLSLKSATATSLKSVSIVNDDRIRLGDLFENLSTNDDYVIGAAPQPGQDMVLNARTLYRIAVAMNLPWRPISTNDQIVIRREATVIPYTQVEQTLRNELKNKGVSGDFGVKLKEGKPSVVLPISASDTVEVSSMNFDRNKDYFTAVLVAPSVENPIKKLEVSGKITPTVRVPVLVSTLQYGDIIGEADIEMVEIIQQDIQANMITSKEGVIGMTPRRMAQAGKYLMQDTLIKPQLVERGEPITITFKQGPLLLTAKGKAMQSGAYGDVIRVTNAGSSRTIDGMVTGDNQVMVE